MGAGWRSLFSLQWAKGECFYILLGVHKNNCSGDGTRPCDNNVFLLYTGCKKLKHLLSNIVYHI